MTLPPFSDITCECNSNQTNLFTLLKSSKFESNQSNSLHEWCSTAQQRELLNLIKSKLGLNRACSLSLVFSCNETNPFDYSFFHNVHAKCNQPNLIIFETNDGEIFGGFTSKPWVRQTPTSESVRDEHAFLFSFNRSEAIPLGSNVESSFELCEKNNLQIYGLAHFQQKVAITILDDDEYGGIMFGRDTLFLSKDCTNSTKHSCSLYIDPRETTYCRGNEVIELEDFYIKRISFYHIL